MKYPCSAIHLRERTVDKDSTFLKGYRVVSAYARTIGPKAKASKNTLSVSAVTVGLSMCNSSDI